MRIDSLAILNTHFYEHLHIFTDDSEREHGAVFNHAHTVSNVFLISPHLRAYCEVKCTTHSHTHAHKSRTKHLLMPERALVDNTFSGAPSTICINIVIITLKTLEREYTRERNIDTHTCTDTMATAPSHTLARCSGWHKGVQGNVHTHTHSSRSARKNNCFQWKCVCLCVCVMCASYVFG